MSAKPSPLPWKTEAEHGARWNISDKTGDSVAMTCQITPGPAGLDKVRDANTALIVRAVNSHAALVEALEALWAEWQTRPANVSVPVENKIRAALKLAKEDK